MKTIYRTIWLSLATLPLATLPLLTLACGDDDGDKGDPLTCEWLEGDNCWKESVKAATQGCAPGEATGVLSADGKTCTFEDGAVINFAKPIDLKAGTNDIEWDFSIVRGGQECASFRETDSGGSTTQLTFTTALGSFTEHVEGTTLSMACPDGAAYSANGFSLLQQCENAFSILPGTATSGTGTTVSFSLLGAAGGSAPLFVCQSAQ